MVGLRQNKPLKGFKFVTAVRKVVDEVYKDDGMDETTGKRIIKKGNERFVVLVEGDNICKLRQI